MVVDRLGKPARVTHTFSRKADNLVEVKSKGIMSRSLFVTDDHPFWVYSARNSCPKTGRPNKFSKEKDFWRLDEWRGFSVGVHQAAGEDFPCGVTPSWKESGKLDIDRDFLTHPLSSVETPCDEINDNRAVLIGWFLAEGFYMHTNPSSVEDTGVEFALGNDEYDTACMIAGLLEKEFSEEFRKGSKAHVRETQSGSYNVWLSNKVVAGFFKKWCGKYSWAKKLALEAMWLPKSLQSKILKACIDGDGCGTLTSRGYSLEMKSRALIQQLQWIAWRLGVKPTYKETGVLPRYSSCDVVDGYEVFSEPSTGKRSRPGYMLRFSCSDSKILDRLAGVEESPMYDKGDKKHTITFKNDEGSWAVSKIDEMDPVDGEFEVHNIEVEGDNSYVVEGVVVHNCEHVQIPELAKGKVIDVAMREVPFTKSQDGKDLTTLYIDILVATNRKHVDIVDKITSGEYSACSMGCLIRYSQCSQCGNIAEDESKACKHVRFFKKNFFYDKNGIRRIVAELCGRAEEPDSCRFIDASWVRKPAFAGAVLRNLVEPGKIDLSEKFDRAFAVPGFVKMDGMYLKAAAAKAADDLVNEIQAQDEPAPKAEAPAPAPEAPPAEAPAPPADDTRFPEAPAGADAPPPEAPAGEAPAEAPAGGDPTMALSLGGGGAPPAGGAPDQPPMPQIEEPVQDATVKEVKDMLKKLVLNDIRKELLKGGLGVATPPEERPTEAENASQTSLVKDASLGRIVKRASKEVGDRLANGLLIMSNLRDWGRMRRYGYSRDDVLGILWYLDRSASGQPVGQDAVKALSRVKLASDGNARRFFTEMIVEIGRKPSVSESRRILKWAGILNRMEK